MISNGIIRTDVSMAQTLLFNSLAGNLVAATQLSSVAMKDTNSDTIFIDASPSSGMNVYRKAPGSDAWSYVYWMQQIFVDLQGCAVGRTNREGELDGVVAMFKESGISVHVMYDQGMLAVQPILPSSVETDQGNKLHGLLGNMNGDPDDDLKRRDTGEPLVDPTEEEILQFGQTWEIESDSELFYYTGSSDHSTYHNTSFVPLMNVNLPTLFPPCEDNKWCLFDYAATGDNEAVALATLGANNAFYQSLEGIQKIDACPFISPPFNGSKTYMSMTNKQFEDAQVYFSCDYPLILVGSAFRVCQYDSEDILGWTGSADAIQCIESQCGFLESPQNGSISLETNGLLAEFSCDEGFSLDGAAEAQCDLTTGEWSATPPSCSVGGGPNTVAIAVSVSLVLIILILLVILGVLYYMKKNKKTKPKKAKTTDDRDAELAEPLNKKPATDVRASTRSSSSNKSNEGNKGPSAQIYKPTPISQASVKYSGGGSGSTKKPSTKPPEPVKKDTELDMNLKKAQPAVNPVVSTVDEKVVPVTKQTTESSAPPRVAPKPKTPDTLRRDPTPSDNGSYGNSAAPSTTYRTPSRDEADEVKGTGLLTNTNITGTGGWI